MMGELMMFDKNKVICDATSLTVTGELSEEEYKTGWIFLARGHKKIMWWIGDYALWGEKQKFIQQGIKSSFYDWLETETHFKRGTIEVAKSVSKSHNSLMRIKELSFNHHQLVAPLPDRLTWLEKAKENKLSVRKLRDAIERNKPILPLKAGIYRVLYADPPWEYYSMQHGKDEEQDTTLETHYPSMSTELICELSEKLLKDHISENAVLFLWVTSPKLFESKNVIDAWGFIYKASIVWDKILHNVGNYVSVRHEFLLICTKGRCLPDSKELHDSVISIERTGHSVKPAYFRELIDKMYPNGNRIELFKRGDLPKGWDGWGNE